MIDVEHLAATIVELREALARERADRIQFTADLRVEISRQKESVAAAHKRVDDFAELWADHRNEMDSARQDASNLLREAARIGREMNERAKAVQEVLNSLPDLKVQLAPLRTALGELRAEITRVEKSVDARFEAFPVAKKRTLEERGEGPSAFTKR